jgi:hypothetical protein
LANSDIIPGPNSAQNNHIFLDKPVLPFVTFSSKEMLPSAQEVVADPFITLTPLIVYLITCYA